MDKIIENMFGVFANSYSQCRKDVLPNIYNPQYIGLDADKKNINQDVRHFLSDFKAATHIAAETN
ncbi:MAG: hypothetical protein FWF72_06815 [Paludibacter sp.]|nr:hypothetical protein [Paludibacter sp.]